VAIATHLIKIKGSLDIEKWTEEKIKKYIDKKLKDEIESLYHADLELLRVKDNDVEVWVYISALPSEATEYMIKKWLNDHIREDSVAVKDVEIVEVVNLLNLANGNHLNFRIHLP
jgi:DNA-directed RNA polymerase beta' subunit